MGIIIGMTNKDISNLSNIYLKVINETKIGSSMAIPVQLGANTPNGGPSSEAVVEIPRKKRKIKKKKISESFIGGFNKGVEMAKAGQPLFQMPWNKPTEEKVGTLGMKNQPKVGQIIVNSSDAKVKAVVLTKINKQGQYNIRLIGNTPSDPSPYKFYTTNFYPDGIISTREKILRGTRDAIKTESDELTAGFNTAYPSWLDYKQVLKRF